MPKRKRETSDSSEEESLSEEVVSPPKNKKQKVSEEEPTTTSTGSDDFSIPAPQPNHIKIVSWNVAGFQAILKASDLRSHLFSPSQKGFAEYVKNEQPDILCLQETKIAANKVTGIPSDYTHYFYGATKPGLHGTGILLKNTLPEPLSVKFGLGIGKHDDEGRCITVEFDTFYIVNTYIPNSGMKLDKYVPKSLMKLTCSLKYRTKEWDVDFQKYLLDLESKKPVIWCGDLNVAHKEIDLKNPKTNVSILD